MRKMRIRCEDVTATATLQDNATANAIWNALPITGQGNRWGAEIYFEIPVRVSQADDARAVVEAGELGFWPPGSAFCVFWGPTPASQGDEIRAASPVNPFGKVEGDPAVFDPVLNGSEIVLEAVSD